jgi:hypothetical protein
LAIQQDPLTQLIASGFDRTANRERFHVHWANEFPHVACGQFPSAPIYNPVEVERHANKRGHNQRDNDNRQIPTNGRQSADEKDKKEKNQDRRSKPQRIT